MIRNLKKSYMRFLMPALLLMIFLILFNTSFSFSCKTSPVPRNYSIAFLYYNFNATEPIDYNTRATSGLESVITEEFNSQSMNITAKRLILSDYDTSFVGAYLNKFDLIVVGGISYWWEYAPNQAKLALLETRTPIISSICYGVTNKNSTELSILSGVSSSYAISRVGSNILRASDITVVFNAPQAFEGNMDGGKVGNLIDVNCTDSSVAYVDGLFENEKYPLLVFNGTKNYLINSFTYDYNRDELEWPILLRVSLNDIFHFLPDNEYALRIFPLPNVKFISNENLFMSFDDNFALPLILLASFLVLSIKYPILQKKGDRNVKSNLDNLFSMLRIDQGVVLVFFVVLVFNEELSFGLDAYANFSVIIILIVVFELLILLCEHKCGQHALQESMVDKS